jgi:hypothetical protein
MTRLLRSFYAWLKRVFSRSSAPRALTHAPQAAAAPPSPAPLPAAAPVETEPQRPEPEPRALELPERSLTTFRPFEPRLPLAYRLRDLGVARPRLFRLDDQLRPPAEVDPLRLPFDAPPPAKPRRVRPRTPLARAPLETVRTRKFRLGAIEPVFPPESPPIDWGWVHPDLKREVVDLDWMARERWKFLGPMSSEWFVLWWDQHAKQTPGAREAVPLELPKELDWALEEVKEQMLIRRDVKKDETVLEPGQLKVDDFEGFTMAGMTDEPITNLIPEKPWVDPFVMGEQVQWVARTREAYLQWRTLVSALEER